MAVNALIGESEAKKRVKCPHRVEAGRIATMNLVTGSLHRDKIE
jgi:hypothetical protein